MEIYQGNTVDIDMTLDTPLGDMVLKAGIYATNGGAVFEAYTIDGGIVFIDTTHYSFALPYEVTKAMSGKYTLQLTAYTDDKMLVTVGQQVIELEVIPRAVNVNLR